MTVLLYVLGVLAVVVGVAVSIALHEVGHLVPAKRFGVRVTQYMVGFGPTVWSRQRGETEYGVKAIPLGGYIRMIGMFPPRRGTPAGMVSAGSSNPVASLVESARAESLEESPARRRAPHVLQPQGLAEARRHARRPGDEPGPGHRAARRGRRRLRRDADHHHGRSGVGVHPPVDAPAEEECGPGDPAAPAAAAGILPGDRVLEADGEPVQAWSDVQQAIREAAGRDLALVVERDGERVPLVAEPSRTDIVELGADGLPVLEEDGSYATVEGGFLGVSPTQDLVRQPVSVVPGQVAGAVAGTAQLVLRLRSTWWAWPRLPSGAASATPRAR